MTSLARRPTAVYWLYDSTGRLLYIGVAVNPPARWSGHRAEKAWWPEVDEQRTVVRWFGKRAEALAAEVAAIAAESPAYNVSHHPDAQRGDAKGRRRQPEYTVAVLPVTPRESAALDDVRRASNEHDAAIERLRLSRERLHAAIVAALRIGVGPSEIARIVPYDRQHIQRIRQAAGIPARRKPTVQRLTAAAHTDSRPA